MHLKNMHSILIAEITRRCNPEIPSSDFVVFRGSLLIDLQFGSDFAHIAVTQSYVRKVIFLCSAISFVQTMF